ncbi:MAG: hypothetical protein COA79_17330 [Planctomycetota bacterium]|nr:MAG: hypothetical protein COA79_17330 [Planctomycetota bacterium]
MIYFYTLLLFIFAFGIFFIPAYLKEKRRKKLFSEPVTEEFLSVLIQFVPLYKKLPDNLQKELIGHMNIFLDEKSFEGCVGLEISTSIKIVIAAQACMLLLNRKTNYYPKLSVIYVYPDAFQSQQVTNEGGVETVENIIRSGESWTNGPVVLSWNHTMHGANDIKDGQNVVFHEFAHQLDQEDGSNDGMPIHESTSQYIAFARMIENKYDKLQKRIMNRKKTVMDPYGGTSKAEFFAVLTETFFEKPRQLKRKHPELYDEVKDYYKLDPLSWK